MTKNPGFAKNQKALKVGYRYNPQLGSYTTLRVVVVKKITSGSAIVDGWDKEEKYSFSDFCLRGEDAERGYGSLYHCLYPISIALEKIEKGEFKNSHDDVDKIKKELLSK